MGDLENSFFVDKVLMKHTTPMCLHNVVVFLTVSWGQSWEVVTKTTWSTKPKLLTTWLIIETVYRPLLQMVLETLTLELIDRNLFFFDHIYFKIQYLCTYCIAQGTLLNALWWPKWEGNPKKRGYMYWVGQKVHSGFSVRCYGKTQTNFLANLIYV